MRPVDYMGFWLVVLSVGLVVHAALTGPPGSLVARSIEAVARYLGWTK